MITSFLESPKIINFMWNDKFDYILYFSGTKAKGYVTIDFDKTDALIKSANQRFFEVNTIDSV